MQFYTGFKITCLTDINFIVFFIIKCVYKIHFYSAFAEALPPPAGGELPGIINVLLYYTI